MAALRSLEAERVAYLGYPIIVRDRDVEILDKGGRRIFRGRCAISTARRIVRSHRNPKET